MLATQGAGAAEEDDYWNPQVVTPSGQPARISETPSATFVITSDEIRKSGAESLPEILRRVPGLEVRQLAASDGQVSARGFTLELSNRVLVLVDGATAHVDLFGGTVFDLLPISLIDIDRIEVVLGPGAAVYGDKAMLATINIITRTASDYPKVEARSSVGPEGDASAALRYGLVSGPLRARATGQLRRVSLFEGRLDPQALASQSATLHVGYAPSSTVELSAEGGVTQARTHVIATASRLDPFRVTIGYLRLNANLGLGGAGAPLGELALRAVWKAGDLRSPVFPTPAENFDAYYDSPYAEISHSLRYEVGDVPMQLRWGGEARLNRVSTTITSGEEGILNLAGFAANEVIFSELRITAGVRVDRQPFHDVIASPRLSLVYTPVEDHQLRAAFNMGYRDPDPLAYFLAFEATPGVSVLGSTRLRAERITYGELGYGGVFGEHLRAFVNLFTYRFDHYIALNPARVLTTGEMVFGNNDPVDAYGGEAGLQLSVRPSLSAHLGYSHVRLLGRGRFPYEGDNLGSPRHKINAGVRYQFASSAYVGAEGQYFGESQVDRVPQVPTGTAPFVTTRLGDFVMVDGRAGYTFESGVDLSLAMTNALNDRTVQFPGGEKPMRRVMATLAYSP